ncbi:MAG: amidohydrolase family protein [Acidobacteria bacterium]|nr:amidohydrolase family protein [Acidobacteriota bacterium]
MKQFCLSLLLIFNLFGAAGSQNIKQAPKTEAQTSIAFVNVNVVPMDRERVLAGQTVIVRDGRIAVIGPAEKTKIPADARRIDGRGKYLMPGLVDMHVHLLPGAGNPDDLAGQQLELFLANGVTTVRNMIGKPEHLTLRDRVAKGELPGPTIFTAGAPLLGNTVPTPEAAERVVLEQKQAGYDLVKVHEGLSPEAYAAIVATAKRVGIPIAGHVTETVGLERALAAHQTSIEHLDGYIRAIVRSDSPAQAPPGQIILGPVLNYVDEKKIPGVVRATKVAEVWNTPTLALFKLIVSDEQVNELLKRPELTYVPPKMRAAFAQQVQGTREVPPPLNERRRFTELRDMLVRELRKAGAKLLVGSDSPQFFLVPGFATHRELQSFVEAGLTPYEALEAATRNPAEYFAQFMHTPLDFGTVEVGKRADLILLEANPLESLSHLQRRAGVMVRGRWLPQSELQSMLDQLEARYRAPAP